MSNAQEMRNIINILNESAHPVAEMSKDHTTDMLADLSPAFAAAEEKGEVFDPEADHFGEAIEEGVGAAVIGATIAFVSVFVGGVETANVGPFDVSGAQQMERTIEADIERAFQNTHPDGFVDIDGKVYQLEDFDVRVETCHSSECSDLIKQRVSDIKARYDAKVDAAAKAELPTNADDQDHGPR